MKVGKYFKHFVDIGVVDEETCLWDCCDVPGLYDYKPDGVGYNADEELYCHDVSEYSGIASRADLAADVMQTQRMIDMPEMERGEDLENLPEHMVQF